MGRNHIERPTASTATATDSVIVPSVAIGLVMLATIAILLCMWLLLLLLLWRSYAFREERLRVC